MTDEFFKTQMERLRTNRNWASSFQDIGRIQRIKDRVKFLEPQAFGDAVTFMIGELKQAPTDTEIFDAVSRFSKRRVRPLDGGPRGCTQCSDGFIWVWTREEPHYESVLRCPCPLGARIPAPIDPKGRQWLTWSPELTGPNGYLTLVRPRLSRNGA